MSENSPFKPDKNLPAHPAGIVFDCDGVMIDSAEGNRAFYNTILHSLGLPSITPKQERLAFMFTAVDALKTILPESLHGQIEELIKNNVNYERDVLPKIRLMPGFREFVEMAAANGLKLGIDTNRTDFGIQAILEHFHLHGLFHPVMTSSKVQPKPSPEGLLEIAAAWETPAKNCIFVGDSEDDMLAAVAAAMPFTSFNNHETPLSDFIVVNDYNQFSLLLFQEPLPGKTTKDR